jgi:hypothetical protein
MCGYVLEVGAGILKLRLFVISPMFEGLTTVNIALS